MENKKRKSRPTQATSPVSVTAKKSGKLKIIIAALLILASLAGVLLGVFYFLDEEIERFDYVNEDLSKYIYISSENYYGYKGYEVKIASDQITERTVDTAIMRILASRRGKIISTGAKDAKIDVGDDINLFFKAYTEEDGVRTELPEFSNFSITAESARTYTVGGGSLDTLGLHLELELVGEELSKYSSYRIKTSGRPQDGDIVYITYSALYNGATSKSGKSVRLDLSDETGIDKAWGEGFTAYIKGLTIGDEHQSTDSFKTEEYSSIHYRSLLIDYAIHEENPERETLTVKTTVPCTYSDVSLQGKEVTFELYISYVNKYTVPTLDKTFIEKTLEIKDEELSKYEGEDTVEKFRKYVKKKLEDDEAAEIDQILIEAMWTHLYSIAQIKELPEDELRRIFIEYKKQIEEAYEENDGGYPSFDAYANAYAQYLGAKVPWEQYFKSQAESEVKQKLIFYYVARAEGLLPTEEEFDKLAKAIVEEELATYLSTLGIKRENYNTDEEYEEAVAPYRSEVEAIYADEEYLEWVVHLEFAEKKMSKLGKVVFVSSQGES